MSFDRVLNAEALVKIAVRQHNRVARPFPKGKKRTMSLTRAVILAALPCTAWEAQESTWEAITKLLASPACRSRTWVEGPNAGTHFRPEWTEWLMGFPIRWSA